MVAQRRLRPLGVVVVLGLGVLAARLFQIQVLEHPVWAAQADGFRDSSSVVPYDRGRFLDRAGRVLVSDEEVASLEFTYRDFRRGHPLGIAAHACTAIEGRPVPGPVVPATFADGVIAMQVMDAMRASARDGGAMVRI